jgi:hypothetical protein
MEWKKYNDKYDVSNLGEIRNNKTNRILKDWTCGSGYRKVQIGSGRLRHTVHRIVAEMFCVKPITNDILEVNHIDCNKLNNNASNLEWCSHQQNCNRKKIHMLNVSLNL